ncbi:MAG: hypothetical protein U0736_24200 [Gemmataceae bacterium]
MSRFTTCRAACAVFLLFALLAGGCRKSDPAGGPATPIPPPPGASGTAPAGKDAFEHLYGNQGGELVAAADVSTAPLRARKDDTFLKLSNARFNPVGRQPFPSISVDYEVAHQGKHNGVALVVRPAEGGERTYLLLGPMQQSGTLHINLGIPIPGEAHPQNAELYLTRQEHRYPNNYRPTFKVSNSAVMGTTSRPLTLARNWTADEAAKLQVPPKNAATPNSNSNAGEDTAFVGDSGGGSFRYAEPGKPVLGVEYFNGEWDKEPCLANLVPVYDPEAPSEGRQRLMARPGYAVGGLTVRTKRYVNAVQVTFMKLTAAGKLDPKDSYQSGWLGHEKVGTKEEKLGGDGRLVIGFHTKKGAILNSIAVVLDR